MSLRVCSTPGCPTLVKAGARGGRCVPCERDHDRARGTRQQRGYDAAYDRERERWARVLRTKPVACWRCHELIFPGFPWHLGHDDEDRSIIRGPEHEGCNLSAAGKASHR